MRKYFSLIFRAFRSVLRYVKGKFQYIACRIILEGNNVEYKKIVTNGVPFVSVARKGECVIGDNFHINNKVLPVLI